jgi:hypothetical protein
VISSYFLYFFVLFTRRQAIDAADFTDLVVNVAAGEYPVNSSAGPYNISFFFFFIVYFFFFS